jgi:hypothetical protein
LQVAHRAYKLGYEHDGNCHQTRHDERELRTGTN